VNRSSVSSGCHARVFNLSAFMRVVLMFNRTRDAIIEYRAHESTILTSDSVGRSAAHIVISEPVISRTAMNQMIPSRAKSLVIGIWISVFKIAKPHLYRVKMNIIEDTARAGIA